MNVSITQQCQVQLELEWITLSTRIQALSELNEENRADPLNNFKLQQARARQQRIAQTRDRMARGVFGMCQRPQCGQPIHPERLLDNACVEFCVSCQQGFERAVLRSHTHQTNLSYQY